MTRYHTKEAAEAILHELPSVLGAFVREDVNGHPREIHLLIAPGPEPRHLARDIRSLLEERLGLPIDQRIISIAQLSGRINELHIEDMEAPGPATAGAGFEAGSGVGSGPGSDAGFERRAEAGVEAGADADDGRGTVPVGASPVGIGAAGASEPGRPERGLSERGSSNHLESERGPSEHGAVGGPATAGFNAAAVGPSAELGAAAGGSRTTPHASGAAASAPARGGGAAVAADDGASVAGRARVAGPERLVFEGVESETRAGRTRVRVRCSWSGETYAGVGEEVEGGHGRVRAAAAAALEAATAACRETLRVDLDAASVVHSFGRDYVLVTAIAVSPLVGRRPLQLAGAHPIEPGPETAAALAALQASNRVLSLALRRYTTAG